MINAILIFLLLSTPFTMMADVEQPQISNLTVGGTNLTNEIINVTFDTSSIVGLTDFEIYFNGLNESIHRSERIEYWTCYDYSIDFEKNNPDLDTVTMSQHKFFYGASHMINYQFYDDRMIIYDGMYDNMYYSSGWDNDYNYYHFWQDNTPIRTYRFLLDNRDVII